MQGTVSVVVLPCLQLSFCTLAGGGIPVDYGTPLRHRLLLFFTWLCGKFCC